MRRYAAIGCVMVMVCAAAARGAILVTDVWDEAENWDIRALDGGAAYGTLTDPQANLDGSGQSGLMITRDSEDTPEIDFVYATQDLVGNWTAIGATPGEVKSIWFDFYASAGGAVDYPAGLRIYFASDSSGSTNIWYYNIDVASLSAGWNTLAADIYATASYGWYSETGTAAQWVMDFQGVDEVGIWLAYQPGVLGQVYGIDNFRLSDQHIPEPGTWWVLGFALVSLGVAFRDRFYTVAVALTGGRSAR